eukprot:Platyproteum_vivax@DN6077_c0_g1_i4.p1
MTETRAQHTAMEVTGELASVSREQETGRRETATDRRGEWQQLAPDSKPPTVGESEMTGEQRQMMVQYQKQEADMMDVEERHYKRLRDEMLQKHNRQLADLMRVEVMINTKRHDLESTEIDLFAQRQHFKLEKETYLRQVERRALKVQEESGDAVIEVKRKMTIAKEKTRQIEIEKARLQNLLSTARHTLKNKEAVLERQETENRKQLAMGAKNDSLRSHLVDKKGELAQLQRRKASLLATNQQLGLQVQQRKDQQWNKQSDQHFAQQIGRFTQHASSKLEAVKMELKTLEEELIQKRSESKKKPTVEQFKSSGKNDNDESVQEERIPTTEKTLPQKGVGEMETTLKNLLDTDSTIVKLQACVEEARQRELNNLSHLSN